MRVVDILNQAIAKVRLAEYDSIPTKLRNLALDMLNRRYETVWNVYPFRDEKLVSVAITTSNQDLVFPQDVDAIRAFRSDDTAIYPLNEIILSRFAPEAFDDTVDEPYNFHNMPDSPVLTQPSAATAITIVSDSASDTSKTVRILGTVSSVDAYEDVTLNGTTPVTGSLSFTALQSISKPLTAGRVTIKEGSTELGTIPAWEFKGAYRKIRLYPIPSASNTFYFEATRRFLRLTSDDDTILLSKVEPAIFSMLMAELYDLKGDEAKSDREESKASALLGAAIGEEEVKDSEDNRSFPDYGMFDDYDHVGVFDTRYKTF